MSEPPAPNPYASGGYNPYAAPTAAYGYGPPPPPPDPTAYLIPAPVGARIVAHIVDVGVVVGVAVGAMFLSGLVIGATGNEANEDLTAAVLLLGFLPGLILQIALQAATGQSLGKRILKLQVVTLDGLPASFARVFLLRNVTMMVIGMLCNLMNIVDAFSIFRMSGITLHDRIASTRVIRAR